MCIHYIQSDAKNALTNFGGSNSLQNKEKVYSLLIMTSYMACTFAWLRLFAIILLGHLKQIIYTVGIHD